MLEEDDSDRDGIGGVLLLFLIVWSLLTLGADCALALNFARQIRASGFPVTQGQIQASELTESWHDGSQTFTINVRYSYTVNGVDLTGRMYRDRPVSGNRREMERLLNSLPPGLKVPVHFDPDRPADSVLETEMRGQDLIVITMIAPFNAAMLGGWIAHVRLIRSGSVLQTRLQDDGVVAWAPVDTLPPSLAAIISAGCSGFAGAILAAITTWGNGENLSVMAGAGTVAVVALAASAAWLVTVVRQRDRSRCVVLDRPSQSLTIPIARNQSPVTVALGRVAGVKVNQLDGSKALKRFSVSVLLDSAAGSPTSVKVVPSTSRSTSQRFASWLRERLPNRSRLDSLGE